MSKFVLSAGIAWVFLSLIIGILLVSTQPVRWVQFSNSSSANVSPMIEEQHRVSENKATARVHIDGTPDETSEVAKSSVTIRK